MGCKWVYKIKWHTQVGGLDYHETFAHVAKMVTARNLLVVDAFRDWEIHQMDIYNAFLRDDLFEEVYMKLPLGFSIGKEG